MGLLDFLKKQRQKTIPSSPPLQRPNSQKLNHLLYKTHTLNTDLTEASYIHCCCAECAKYRERVYSISGKDTRYPLLPNFLLSDTHDCGIFLHPFIDGVNSMRTRDGRDLRGRQVIKYSNRPFVDDRTQDELDDILREEYRLTAEQEYFKAQEEYRADYTWLQKILSDQCPKSFSGYMRMRNANTTNYQKLRATAAHHGRLLK